jgi:hypothetical protein
MEVLMQRKKIWIILLGLAMAGLCGLMILVVFFSVRSFGAPDIRSWNFQVGAPGITASADETKTYTVSTPAELEIINPVGDVTLIGTPDEEISISMHKASRGVDQKSANENLEKIAVNITQDGNSVKIEVPQPEGNIINPASVDFVIKVPQDTVVNADITNGNLDASNLANNAVLNSSFGSVNLSDLQKGSLTASSDNGSVTVHGVMSESQPIELSSNFGSIDLSDAVGSEISATSQNGEVTISKAETSGPITVENEFGQVLVENTRGKILDITSRNGSINVSGTRIDSTLTAKNDFGDIILHSTLSGAYDLKNKNGSIVLDQAGGAVTASSDFGSIEISNGESCNLNLSSQNGSISYQGSLGAGPHTLSSNFGSIDLSLPANSALTADLKTEFGEINNNFEITTDGSQKEHHQTGKINGGGAVLNIQVNNGSITLEKTGN